MKIKLQNKVELIFSNGIIRKNVEITNKEFYVAWNKFEGAFQVILCGPKEKLIKIEEMLNKDFALVKFSYFVEDSIHTSVVLNATEQYDAFNEINGNRLISIFLKVK